MKRTAYQYEIPAKSRILNLFRRVFKNNYWEQQLRKKIGKGNSFYKKLVPPEYLYKAESYRVIEREGINLRLDLSCVNNHEIFYNLNDRSFWKFISSLNQINRFIDVGANIGWTTLQVGKLFPQAAIYCIEPSKKTAEKLWFNLELNNLNPKVLNLGLGKEHGTFKLYSISENNPGMNRILVNDPANHAFEEIEVKTGDELFKNEGKVDLIKIDVEGFEMNVLLGMNQIINRDHPALFIELNDSMLHANQSSSTEILNWLLSKNYKLYNAQTRVGITEETAKQSPDHFDVIAV